MTGGRRSTVVMLLLLPLLLGSGGSAVAQSVSVEGDLQRIQQKQDRILGELESITKELDQIKSELHQGNEIVSNFSNLVNRFKSYLSSVVRQADTCFDLQIQADNLKAKNNPTWPRFHKRATECMSKVKSDDLLEGVYRRAFEDIEQKVGYIKEAVDVLETNRNSSVARQQKLQAERDLNESILTQSRNADAYLGKFTGN